MKDILNALIIVATVLAVITVLEMVGFLPQGVVAAILGGA